MQDILIEPEDIYTDDENTMKETYETIFFQDQALPAPPQTEGSDVTYETVFTGPPTLEPTPTPPPLPPLPNSIISSNAPIQSSLPSLPSEVDQLDGNFSFAALLPPPVDEDIEMTVYQPAISAPPQQPVLPQIPMPWPPISYIQPQPIYIEINDYNPPTTTHENQVPALTYIEPEVEDIDVNEPLAIEAASELLALDTPPELLPLEAPSELLPLETLSELHLLDAPPELIAMERAPTEQELETSEELMAIEAPQQLLTLEAPPLELEPIMIDKVGSLLPQLHPPSIKFPVSNNFPALPSSTNYLLCLLQKIMSVTLPTLNK